MKKFHHLRIFLLFFILISVFGNANASCFYKTMNESEIARYKQYLKKEMMSDRGLSSREFDMSKDAFYANLYFDSIIFDLAIKHKDVNMINKIITTKKNIINETLPGGDTFLGVAVCNKDIKTVKILVENGANVNFVTDNIYTPLALAVSVDDIEITKYLIEQGADINFKNYSGETILDRAIINNGENSKIVQYLISIGAKKGESN